MKPAHRLLLTRFSIKTLYLSINDCCDLRVDSWSSLTDCCDAPNSISPSSGSFSCISLGHSTHCPFRHRDSVDHTARNTRNKLVTRVGVSTSRLPELYNGARLWLFVPWLRCNVALQYVSLPGDYPQIETREQKEIFVTRLNSVLCVCTYNSLHEVLKVWENLAS